MIGAKDHLTQLAEVDAPGLAEDYRTFSARAFDRKARSAWERAADDAGVDRRDEALRDHYLRALLGECARQADAFHAREHADHLEEHAIPRRDEQTGYFCARTVRTERAVEEGWTPDFWFNESEPANAPACPECAAERLTDLESDPILKDPRRTSP
jgi:hypothetical protein